MGSCTHPHIAGLRIKRHNDAVREIAKLVRLSDTTELQNAIIFMDAGKEEDHLIQSAGSRLPDYMFPADMEEAERNKYRPDITILTVPPHLDRQKVREEIVKEQCSIYILEVSFCGDTRYREHKEHKSQQHIKLVEKLIEAGWKKENIHLLDPLLFGIGGSLYTSTTAILTTDLQVPKRRVRPTLHKIQKTAAHKANQIVKTRRALEAELGIQLGPSKGPRQARGQGRWQRRP